MVASRLYRFDRDTEGPYELWGRGIDDDKNIILSPLLSGYVASENLLHRLGCWQRKKGPTALPCFRHSYGSARFPSVTTNDNLMTELAASAIALMLTIELAVAIACVAAWFELQRASEGRSAKQAHGVAAARTPAPRWPAFAATLPLEPRGSGNAP
jgi:hypothetical protein